MDLGTEQLKIHGMQFIGMVTSTHVQRGSFEFFSFILDCKKL